MAIISNIIATVIFLVVFLVGGIALQIYLSRRESRWPGLVLPVLTFIGTLLAVYQKCAWSKGELNVFAVYITVLAGSIPPLILLAVYWGVRKRRRVQDQLDKMKIDDL